MKKFSHGKVIAVFLVLVLVVSSFPAFASPIASIHDLDDNYVFVDGVKFSVQTHEDYTVVVKPVGVNSDAKLVVDMYGQGTVYGVYYHTANVHINDLTFDTVDIVVTCQVTSETLDTFGSISSVMGDSYDGQISIVIGIKITTGMLITALLKTATIIIVAGAKFHAISTVTDTLRSQQGWWFEAHVVKKRDVYVNPFPICIDAAAHRIRNGIDVYTFTKSKARKAVTHAGFRAEGPEWHTAAGVQLQHFHTHTRNGSHSLFGLPRPR